jgi:hypothetical protein
MTGGSGASALAADRFMTPRLTGEAFVPQLAQSVFGRGQLREL